MVHLVSHLLSDAQHQLEKEGNQQEDELLLNVIRPDYECPPPPPPMEPLYHLTEEGKVQGEPLMAANAWSAAAGVALMASFRPFPRVPQKLLKQSTLL